MFRLWVRQWKDSRLLKDVTISDDTQDTRTHKVFRAIEEACYGFDLGKPIWLDRNIAEFRQHAVTRFYQDNFVEEVPFDYLEIRVIEED